MGVTAEGYENIEQKTARFFENLAPDLELVGRVAAEGIVRTTLAGIGEGDQPFAAYSDSYQEQLEAVGGKARGTVDLRGVFEKKPAAGKKPKELTAAQRVKKLRKGALRSAYVKIKRGGNEFFARTKTTRPALGLTDKQSEMSLDLIKVESTDKSLTLTYTPRDENYMIGHHQGTGTAPKRTWFTINRVAILRAMNAAMVYVLKARAQWFNQHGSSISPPKSGGALEEGRKAFGGGDGA